MRTASAPASPPVAAHSRPEGRFRFPLGQLFLMRMREYFREPAVIFWTYGFPLFLAIGLGVAFADGQLENLKINIAVRTPSDPESAALQERLERAGIAVTVEPETAARQHLRDGCASVVVIPKASGYDYVFDPTRSDSVIARYRVDALVQRWKAGASAWTTTDQHPDQPGGRYIDFLLPGLIGLNLLGGGLWGVGYVIVDMRVRKLLKRLRATPMRRSDFLLSILGGRMLFLVPEVLVLVLFGRLVFETPIRGSTLVLAVVVGVSALAFASLGLLLASRARNSETISGLINVMMIPMWMFSGTFFSPERFPHFVQPLAKALPLTQVNEAMRAVMLDGSSLTEVSPQILILAAWGIVSFVLAIRWFRWL